METTKRVRLNGNRRLNELVFSFMWGTPLSFWVGLQRKMSEGELTFWGEFPGKKTHPNRLQLKWVPSSQIVSMGDFVVSQMGSEIRCYMIVLWSSEPVKGLRVLWAFRDVKESQLKSGFDTCLFGTLAPSPWCFSQC